MADEVPMTEPRLAKHNENRFNWGTLHGASVPGYVRAVRAPFAATNHASYVLLVPRGQGAPAHRSTGEHTVILLEGEVEFEFPDDRPAELFVMNEHDLLFIPESMKFQYANVGRTDAVLIMVVGKGPTGAWPPTGTY